MKEFIKNFLKKLVDIFNKIPPLLFKIFFISILMFILIIIVMISVNASFSDDLSGTCIEADEFGTRKNIILAKPENETDFLVKNSYDHEKIKQKVKHTDLGLSLNGDPLAINITGKWIPWLGDYSKNIEGTENQIVLKSKLENKGLPDNNFFCALEKYKVEGVDFTVSNKIDENEFYYVKNYYKSINKYKNETDKDVTINVNGKDLYTVKSGSSLIYGYENVPEKQKDCWITRGAGLYLGSYGINGKTQPTAYHHLIASKMVCSQANWFNSDIKLNSDIIVKYKEPTGIDWDNCKDANGKTCVCENKREDLGTCSYYSNPSANVLVDCDCKIYETKNYTYQNFIENYFDVNYHLSENSSLDETLNKTIIENNNNQVIYNIELHENLLYENNVENVGYIVASSMEKFLNACYKNRKDIDGNIVREYKSYFQYGPKHIYKNVSNLQNIQYSYGEKIRMFIADKYYEDNDGFYNIEIISGIDLDEKGSFEGKLQEIEFFLLGTPNPGQENDRADGMVATIFNNILSTTFVSIARIIMVITVMLYGFGVIFGFLPDEDSGNKYKYKLLKTFTKIGILVTLLSANAFQFFNKIIINFFVNGTIGIIDLISGIFSNSFMDNTISLTGGLQYSNEIMSLSRNFAIVDEILAFFDGYAVTAKILSFFFNLDEMFMIGCFISVAIFCVLLLYVAKLIQSIVPFIFVLLQLTIVLPLAPVCLAISLIDKTKFVMDGWIKFVLSKCLELVAFFTAFYFCTSIINNFIKALLSFKVCFIPLGDYLMPSVDNNIEVEGARDFFEFNWLVESIKEILNNFIAASQEGLPDNWFFAYCINISIIFALVILFDTLTKNIMQVISSMLSVDGASASGGPLSDTGKFGVGSAAHNFLNTTGLAQMQKDSKLLAWTRNFVDLSATNPIKDNLLNAAKGVANVVNETGNVVGKNNYNKMRGVETSFKQDMAKVAGKAVTGMFGKMKEEQKDENGNITKSGHIFGNTFLDASKWGEEKSSDIDPSKKVDGKSDWASRAKNSIDDWFGDNKNLDSPVSKEYNNLSKEEVRDELRSLKVLKETNSITDFYKELYENSSLLNKLKEIVGNKSVEELLLAMQLNKNNKLSNEKLDEVFETFGDVLRSDKMYEKYYLESRLENIIGEDKILEAVEDLKKEAELEQSKKEGDSTSLLEGDSTSLLEQDVSSLIKETSSDLLSGDSTVLLTALKKIKDKEEQKSKLDISRQEEEKRRKQEKRLKELEEIDDKDK